jgi:hypothetical protein
MDVSMTGRFHAKRVEICRLTKIAAKQRMDIGSHQWVAPCFPKARFLQYYHSGAFGKGETSLCPQS